MKFKVGDRVRIKSLKQTGEICDILEHNGREFITVDCIGECDDDDDDRKALPVVCADDLEMIQG